jgi:hypothetical protein
MNQRIAFTVRVTVDIGLAGNTAGGVGHVLPVILVFQARRPGFTAICEHHLAGHVRPQRIRIAAVAGLRFSAITSMAERLAFLRNRTLRVLRRACSMDYPPAVAIDSIV